jgi:undecaprenyl pyrophosphate phosphatase UppP
LKNWGLIAALRVVTRRVKNCKLIIENYFMTLSLFLLAYYIFLAIFVIFSLFAIYHLAKFVPPSSLAFFTTYIFLAGAILIIFITWQELQSVDWTQTVFTFTTEL